MVCADGPVRPPAAEFSHQMYILAKPAAYGEAGGRCRETDPHLTCLCDRVLLGRTDKGSPPLSLDDFN